jgi:hypothetical protein
MSKLNKLKETQKLRKTNRKFKIKKNSSFLNILMKKMNCFTI